MIAELPRCHRCGERDLYHHWPSIMFIPKPCEPGVPVIASMVIMNVCNACWCIGTDWTEHLNRWMGGVDRIFDNLNQTARKKFENDKILIVPQMYQLPMVVEWHHQDFFGEEEFEELVYKQIMLSSVIELTPVPAQVKNEAKIWVV